jgi:tyrosyl-tRNA synthetase
MKGVDKDNLYLAYYSLLRKTVKWTKKVALWLINYALFNSFSIYKNLNRRMKLRYKEFLLRVAKAWSTEQMEAAQAVRHRLSATRTANSNST